MQGVAINLKGEFDRFLCVHKRNFHNMILWYLQFYAFRKLSCCFSIFYRTAEICLSASDKVFLTSSYVVGIDHIARDNVKMHSMFTK